MSLEIGAFGGRQCPERIGCRLIRNLIVNPHTNPYGAQRRKDARLSGWSEKERKGRKGR